MRRLSKGENKAFVTWNQVIEDTRTRFENGFGKHFGRRTQDSKSKQIEGQENPRKSSTGSDKTTSIDSLGYSNSQPSDSPSLTQPNPTEITVIQHGGTKESDPFGGYFEITTKWSQLCQQFQTTNLTEEDVIFVIQQARNNSFFRKASNSGSNIDISGIERIIKFNKRAFPGRQNTITYRKLSNTRIKFLETLLNNCPAHPFEYHEEKYDPEQVGETPSLIIIKCRYSREQIEDIINNGPGSIPIPSILDWAGLISLVDTHIQEFRKDHLGTRSL
ncbi:uncharacterized protein SPAPADRAFT_49161 [Spathaspora passalidarum NRRL Y-27907]|uniref:Uncharacterized protein n=1 Tax=Spathaspora passalidarum (strain NRRL Y-27907 / 11-Y1) TaxID=619300 RepID=G3AHC3_SPAPN|nr:uncharacterized protein SPAPADRAFT_49161 [Spathaspora passalidarum NRRL Y-27907]EGW34087.1 hypothetical protein SPAPADRAFT_49161 [Spathaspora passalidarum NRRL Y-27907]